MVKLIGIMIYSLLLCSSSKSQSNCIKECYDKIFTHRADGLKENMTNEAIIKYTKNTDSLLQSCIVSCYLPDFSFKTINGLEINNITLKNKIIIINFWYPGCISCHKEIPALQKLGLEYNQNSEIILLSISYEMREKVIQSLPESSMIGWKLIVEEKVLSNEIAKFYPTTIITDKSGKIAGYWMGIPDIEDNKIYIYNQLKAVLKKLGT